MSDVETHVPSPIAKLPIEMVQEILSNVEDVEVLRAAVLSCRQFNDAFREAKVQITFRVLDLDRRLLHEAAQAWWSSQLTALIQQENIKDSRWPQAYWEESITYMDLPIEERNLAMLPYLRRLYPIVKTFATQFAWKALAESHLKQTAEVGPSRNELMRFMHAFLMFESYCDIFCDLAEVGLDGTKRSKFNKFRWELFWRKYQLPEVERLACVQDFLVEALAPGFDEIAESDIELGHQRVPWGLDEYLDDGAGSGVYDQRGPLAMQGLLMKGLENLQQFLQAETYEERERLTHLRGGSCPLSGDFLLKGLAHLHGSITRGTGGYGISKKEVKLGAVYYDTDSGPLDILRASHDHNAPRLSGSIRTAMWAYEPLNIGLRECAWVMWDRSRLERAGILTTPWIVPIRAKKLTSEEAYRHYNKMADSWEEREMAWNKGYRGRYKVVQ